MVEGGDSQNPTSKNLSLCNECGSNPWKYRCPGCSIRSCSLPCVNSHKKRTGCTGKRNRAEFVPLSKFDDNQLLSDYTFLEETKRFAESARRMVGDFRGRFKLPNELRRLRYAAKWRRFCLLFFPPGMSKRESNQSVYDSRKNSIFWTIELRFHGTDVVTIHHGVDEHVSLWSILGKQLAPAPWNHKLRPFCDVPPEDLKLFLRKNPKGLNSVFRQLDINLPLSSQLRHVLILEYPVIFVYLPSHDHDFQVETTRRPIARKTQPMPSDDMQSHKGTLFREVEIEQGGEIGEIASDTRVMDLMDRGKPAAAGVDVPGDAAAASPDAKVEEETRKEEDDDGVDFADDHMQKASIEDCSHLDWEEGMTVPARSSFMESEEGGFCFEQELTDAYSDLIGEMNPDDFLCLDAAGYNEVDAGGYLGEASWCFLEEGDDLEEGEIPCL